MDNQNPNPNLNQPNLQTPAPVPQPVQETTPAQSKTNSGNSSAIIAILLLLFVYPLGLLFAWFGTKWPKWVKVLITLPVILGIIGIVFAVSVATRNPKVPISSSTSPTPTVTLQTQGGRIVNTDGGYSFILPAPWKTKISSFSKTDTIFGTSFLGDLGIGDIKVSTGDKSLSDALSKQNPKYISNPTQITVDSIPGIIEDYSATDGKIKIEGKVVVVYKDGKTYTIEVLSSDPEDLAKFQEILSSFKFTQ